MNRMWSALAVCAAGWISIGNGGCVVEPSAYTRVANENETFTFSGYDDEPGASIRTEAWNFPASRWDVLSTGRAVSSASATNWYGTSIYPFSSDTVRVPYSSTNPVYWKRGYRGSYARLRLVHTSDGEVLAGVHDSWLDCLQRHGGSAPAFAGNCRVSSTIELWTEGYRMVSDTALVTGGSTSTTFGSPTQTRCVYDVPTTFVRMGATSANRHRFPIDVGNVGRVPPYDANPNMEQGDDCDPVCRKHVQSVQRLPVAGTGNWMVLSKSSESYGRAGLMFGRWPHIENDGDSWKHSTVRTGDKGRVEYYYPMPWTTHSGGMQVVGDILAVGADGLADAPLDELGRPAHKGELNLFDASDPANVHLIQRVPMPGYYTPNPAYRPECVSEAAPVSCTDESGQPYLWEGMAGAAWVGLTRLQDGRYLAIVGGWTSGKDSGYVLVTNRARIDDATEWLPVDSWGTEEGTITSNLFDNEFQNVNLVTECGSGQIYGIGMKKGLIKLFTITEVSGRIVITGIDQRNIDEGSATMRAGAGIFVTNDGRDMTLYATERTDHFDGELDVVEMWPPNEYEY